MSIHRLSAQLEQQARLLDMIRQEQEWAISRYDDLGRFLVENLSGRADVNVYAQGSFRLGTVVKPADGAGDSDIDLARESVTRRAGVRARRCRAREHRELGLAPQGGRYQRLPSRGRRDRLRPPRTGGSTTRCGKTCVAAGGSPYADGQRPRALRVLPVAGPPDGLGVVSGLIVEVAGAFAPPSTSSTVE